MYVVIERAILRSNTAVMGSRYVHNRFPQVGGSTATVILISMSSFWVFLLLSIEAIRTYKTNPFFVIGPYHIPTWTTPLVIELVTAALIPSSSLLGHLCGIAVGYLCKIIL